MAITRINPRVGQSKVVIFFFFFLPFLRSLYPMHIIQAQTRFQVI
jgi:hypothetical protein